MFCLVFLPTSLSFCQDLNLSVSSLLSFCQDLFLSVSSCVSKIADRISRYSPFDRRHAHPALVRHGPHGAVGDGVRGPRGRADGGHALRAQRHARQDLHDRGWRNKLSPFPTPPNLRIAFPSSPPQLAKCFPTPLAKLIPFKPHPTCELFSLSANPNLRNVFPTQSIAKVFPLSPNPSQLIWYNVIRLRPSSRSRTAGQTTSMSCIASRTSSRTGKSTRIGTTADRAMLRVAFRTLRLRDSRT